MTILVRNHIFLALLMLSLLLIACDKENNPVSSNPGFCYSDGEIYDKTDGDNNGSTGKMDYQGYTYKVIKIGRQWWMAENLRVTKYNDGTAIENVTANDAWAHLKSGAWCDYDNNPSNGLVYGKLYSWFAVNSKKLAPPGWHVPSDDEWTVLERSLGLDMSEINDTGRRGELANVGGKMREAGTEHWEAPNEGATNESGFTALGGGVRNYEGAFLVIRKFGFFWSSSMTDGNSGVSAWYRFVSFDDDAVFRSMMLRREGYSVRCVKD